MSEYQYYEFQSVDSTAVDFDKGQWQDDVTAFTKTCHAKGVPHAVERSRSGNGAHVWFFFTAPVSAGVARKMGCFLITETMAGRHELPMTSYDRFFPNQDTMPRGGFGNLIALPFQDGPRQQGITRSCNSSWGPPDSPSTPRNRPPLASLLITSSSSARRIFDCPETPPTSASRISTASFLRTSGATGSFSTM